MKVAGINIPVEDYLLTCVTNASPDNPDWAQFLRGADLERLYDLARIVGRNLASRNSGVTISGLLADVGARISTHNPHLADRWIALVNEPTRRRAS